MRTKKFSRDYLTEELDLPYSAISNEIIDTSRWSVYHKIVFEDNGKFYSAIYSEGATELQDEKPWEYQDKVECIEVELKEIKVKEWVPVVENEEGLIKE